MQRNNEVQPDHSSRRSALTADATSRTLVKFCFNRMELAKSGNLVARPNLTRRVAMACGNSTIESSMGSAAKLATAASKLGGAIEQSSVKSSTPERNGWDGSRQYLVYLRCSCGTRMQTSGGDTFFDTWLKNSRDQRRMQTSRQPCDTMPAHNARNRSVQDGGLQCILGPAPCLLKTVGKLAIDEHSSCRQAPPLPLTLSFVRVTSTTTTPTLHTADPCHAPQHTLKLPRPSSRLQGTPAPGNCNGIPGVLE